MNPDHTKRRHKVIFKKFLKYVCLGTLIVLTSILIIIAIFQIPMVQKMAADAFLDRLSQRLHRNISVDKISFSLFGKVEIKGFTFSDDPEFSALPMASVESVVCIFNPMSIMRNKLHIYQLILKKPAFRLIYNKDREANIFCGRPRKKKKKRDRSDDSAIRKIFNTIPVDHISIIHGTYDFQFAPNNLLISVPLFNLEAKHLSGKDEMRLQFESAGVRVQQGKRLDVAADVNLMADFWGDGVHHSQLTVISSAGDIWINGSCKLDKFTDPALDFSANAWIRSEEIVKMLKLPVQIHGNIGLKSSGTGPARDLIIRADLFGRNLSIDRLPVQSIYTHVVFSDKSFDFPTIAADIYSGKLHGTGKISFQPEKNMVFNARLDNFNVRDACESQKIPILFPGSGTLNLHLENPGLKSETVIMNGNLTATESTTDSIFQPLSLFADFRFQDRTFQIPNARLFNDKIRIGFQNGEFSKSKFRGRIDVDCENADLILQRISKYYRTTLNIPALKGRISAGARLTGKTRAYKIQFKCVSPDLKFRENLKLGNISLTGFVTPEMLSVSNILLNGYLSHLNGRFRLAFSHLKQSGTILEAVALDIHSIKLSELNKLIHLKIPIGGIASGSVFLNTSELPEKRSHLKIQRLSVNKIQLGKTVLDCNWNKNGIFNLNLTADEGTGKIHMHGNFPFHDHQDWSLSAENFDISRLNTIQPIPVSGSGNIRIETSADTSPETIHITGLIPDCAIRNQAVGDTRIEALLTRGKFTDIQWKAVVGEAQAVLSGQTVLANSIATSLNAAFYDMQIPTLIAVSPIFNMAPQIKGTLSGIASLSILGSDLSSLDVKTRISKLSGTIFDLPLDLQKPTVILVKGKNVTINRAEFKNRDLNLDLSGRMILGGDLDIQLSGDWNLARIASLTNFINKPKGLLTYDVQITGPPTDPDFSGSALIQELYFKNPLFKIDGEDFHSEIKFNHKLASIEYFEGMANGAYFNLEGDIGIKNFVPRMFDLRLSSQWLPFEFPEHFKSIADIDLNLSGNSVSPLLEGSIHIFKSLYNQRISIKSMIVNESRKKLIMRQRKWKPLFSENPAFNPKLKINIQAPNNVVIDNNFAKMEMKIDMDVAGELAKFRLLGQVEAIKGEILYQGRTFKIDHASLSFNNKTQIDPYIDLSASSDIESYHVTVEITGPVFSNPQVKLYSSPPLNDLDLVSLVGLGKTSEQLTASENNYIAGGVGYVTGGIQDEMERRFKSWMGFDEFNIDPILSSTDESPTARITVKKSFSPDLSVTYSRSVGTLGDLLILEYKLSDTLFLVGQKNEDGSLGTKLKFRWEIR